MLNRKEIGIRESFNLVYNVPNREIKQEELILKKLALNYSIDVCNNAPALSEVKIQVKDIFAAVELFNKIQHASACIEEIEKDWNIGLYTKGEREEKLSQFMQIL